MTNRNTAQNTAAKKRGRPFQAGMSGNPAGRPKGSRNRATLLMQQMIDGEVEEITRKLIDLAKDGDPVALKLWAERMLPPARDRCIEINVPRLQGLEDLPAFGIAVVNAIAAGELTAAEGRALLEAVDAYRRGLVETEIEKRIAALEEAEHDRTIGGEV